MKILLVEDEQAHFETFSNVLEDIAPLGQVKLVWARTDKEAIEKFKQHTIALTFMDISLKGSQFNGIELIRVIRNNLQKEIPIVTFSISRDPEDKRKALEAGSNLYIRKPFNYEEMIQIVSSLIERVKKGELIAEI